MKALVYTGPEALDYREVADPDPAGDETVVAVESVGICGSDMHAYLGHDDRRPPPLTLGHEVAGLAGGRHVTVNPLVTCGTCRYCTSGRDNLCPTRQIISMPPREGGFAEAVAIPERNLVEMPADFPTEKAALCEPVACGWHAARIALDRPVAPRRALAIGGGAIGLGAALALVAQGQDTVEISEPNAARRDFIRDRVGLAVRAPDEIEPGDGFDIVIDGVGVEATRAQASELVAPGGIIVHIGLGSASGGLLIRRMTLQEITFVGTYTYTARDFRDTARAMVEGHLGALDWTETRPLSEGARAFADIRSGRVAAPKIILKP